MTMRKGFSKMKKLLSILLCAVVLVACIPFIGRAAEEDNIALKGVAYSSADYNEWAAKRFLNDKDLNNYWMAQHVSRDPKVGVVGEYCGIRYIKDYHAISEIRVCISLNAVTFGINVLVEGEWIELAEMTQDEATSIDGKSWLIIKLDEPVVTNDVRVVAKDYAGWNLPQVYEIEIYGAQAKAPELIVPEGGIITMNAALAGMAFASSSAEGHYPAYVNDGASEGVWMPDAEATEPQYVGVRYTAPRTIKEINVYTGADNGTPYTETVQIEALIGGQWKTLATGVANADNGYSLSFSVPAIETEYVRAIVSSEDGTPRICEIETVSKEKNVAVLVRQTDAYKAQLATGNVAVLGTPYALTTFELYSTVNSINDGITAGDKAMWVAMGSNVPTYCGVTLPVLFDVNKVVIAFEDEGDSPHIMKFDVQVRVGDTYETVATGYSYNPTTGYVAILEFETVATNDVRIVFTKHGDTFPNLNELQIYCGPDPIDNPYDGYATDLPMRGPEKPAGYDEAAAEIENS